MLLEQQPAHPLVASHTQTPALHRNPAPHAAFVPHLHWPPLQVSAFALSHATQVDPLVPHAPVVGVWQLLPEQHPVGHDVASHTQLPDTQCWPAAHTAPEPQAHWPLVHRSAFEVSHAAHAAPLVPHVAVVGVVHALFLQHPVGHDVESHVQAPETQRCPAEHAAPLPHLHSPALVQLSACAGSHVPHASPAAAQASSPRGLHVEPEQQPEGQAVALHPLHTPAVQLWPFGHFSQAAPPEPQADASAPERHWLLKQHPGHDVAVQVHASATQAKPGSQLGTHKPHTPSLVQFCTLRQPPAHGRASPSWHSGPASAL